MTMTPDNNKPLVTEKWNISIDALALRGNATKPNNCDLVTTKWSLSLNRSMDFEHV